MLKLPSGFVNQPSNAGVMLAPRSRNGSRGRAVFGVCAAVDRAQPATIANVAADIHRRYVANTPVIMTLASHQCSRPLTDKSHSDRIAHTGRLAQLVRARASHAHRFDGRMLEAVGCIQLLACALRVVSGRFAAFSARGPRKGA